MKTNTLQKYKLSLGGTMMLLLLIAAGFIYTPFGPANTPSVTGKGTPNLLAGGKTTPHPLPAELKKIIRQSGVREKHLSILILHPASQTPSLKNNTRTTTPTQQHQNKNQPNKTRTTKNQPNKDIKTHTNKPKSIKKPNLSRLKVPAPAEQIIFHLNENKTRTPASLIKIFTASALLSQMSPTLTFTTRFLTTQSTASPTLNGNLYLKGGGDPEFVSESLWNLVNNLSRTGLKHINGNLIVDDTYFQTNHHSSKKSGKPPPKKTHFSYDAPSSALSFNWNTANIYIRPGLKPSRPLRVNIDPFGFYFLSLKNNTRTTRAGGKKSLTLKKISKGSREALVVSGTLPIKHKEILIYRNVTHPALWTGFNALGFLKEKGITFSGKVLKGQTPAPARELARWESTPLINILKRMMKYSNNYMVQMLVKNLATQIHQKPGSLKQGLKIIQEHLSSLNITSYKMKEASGLSRNNRLTTRELATVLKHWLYHPLQPEFEAALPLAGRDGTLKKRFINHPAKNFIRAKTGSLTGVSGLAGYLHTTGNKKLIFVFLFNGPASLKPRAEALFEDLLLAVYQKI